MLVLAATVMLLGFVLNSLFNLHKNAFNKMLMLMSIVNVLSIIIYLFNFKSSFPANWSFIIVFFDITIIILNLIISKYVLSSFLPDDSNFEKLILNLFGVTFLSDCLFIFLIYLFKAQSNFFNISNPGFLWIYIPLTMLMLWGTILPAIKYTRILLKNKQNQSLQLCILLILNLFNNLAGLLFYTLEFPSKESSIIINMIANLGFGYYLGYLSLREYFVSKKRIQLPKQSAETNTLIYTWDEYKTHLGNWSEARSYLLKCLPSIVHEIEQFSLSDLEKVHTSLKKLKVTSKEAAEALNVSVRTVETQRYRISKKIDT